MYLHQTFTIQLHTALKLGSGECTKVLLTYYSITSTHRVWTYIFRFLQCSARARVLFEDTWLVSDMSNSIYQDVVYRFHIIVSDRS